MNTQYEHYQAANSLGNYNQGAFVVGSDNGDSYLNNNKVEVLEIENGSLKWNLKKSYPYQSR